MHLVYLGTSGNQDYVFASNKLRENLGASDLTARATTWWVAEALRGLGGPDLLAAGTQKEVQGVLVDDWPTVRRRILDPKVNQHGGKYEVVYLSSGVSLVIAQNEDAAKELIGQVSRRVLEKAPGLAFTGCFVEATMDNIHEKVKDLFEKEKPVSGNLPRANRFMRLPFVAPCATNSLPAARRDIRDGVTTPADPENADQYDRRSKVSLCKRKQREKFWHRIAALDGATEDVASVVNIVTTEWLEEQFEHEEWLAVVHADGNGFGKIFTNFGLGVPKADYVPTIRQFSILLEECTERAFTKAVASLKADIDEAPGVRMMVPLVLGGDDITVVVRASEALAFTETYLEEFLDETKQADGRDATYGFQEVLKMFGFKPQVGMGAAAGIAVVKPHFPFHTAYSLAEELCKRAKKQTKAVFQPPVLSIDFHTVFDAGYVKLSDIESGQVVPGHGRLTAKPLVIGDPKATGARESAEWQHRTLEKFNAAVKALGAKNEDNRPLVPATQTHALREALFQGVAPAEAKLAQVKAQLGGNALKEVLAGGNVFFPAIEQGENGPKQIHRTMFLDVLDWLHFADASDERQNEPEMLQEQEAQA
ncbi:MAG: hypothetical protein AMXMBFR81_22950 [Chthonomonas sp.]